MKNCINCGAEIESGNICPVCGMNNETQEEKKVKKHNKAAAVAIAVAAVATIAGIGITAARQPKEVKPVDLFEFDKKHDLTRTEKELAAILEVHGQSLINVGQFISYNLENENDIDKVIKEQEAFAVEYNGLTDNFDAISDMIEDFRSKNKKPDKELKAILECADKYKELMKIVIDYDNVEDYEAYNAEFEPAAKEMVEKGQAMEKAVGIVGMKADKETEKNKDKNKDKNKGTDAGSSEIEIGLTQRDNSTGETEIVDKATIKTEGMKKDKEKEKKNTDAKAENKEKKETEQE